MQQPNIFISTPCYSGKVDLNYHVSMMMTMKHLGEGGIKHLFNYAVSTGVDAARSKHATEFLRDTQCTHLMFIDDDMAWAPDLVFRLLIEDVDIVGVPYRRKIVNPVRFTARHGYDLEYKENKPYMVKMDGLGTGMMLIKREVFEKLLPTTPSIQYHKDGPLTHMFFKHELLDHDEMIGGRTYMSEDYSFCKRAKEAGFDIWGYVDEDVCHVGTVAYRGTYADVLEDGTNNKLRYERQRMAVRLVGDMMEEIIEVPMKCMINGEEKVITAQALRMEKGILIPFYAFSEPESETTKIYLQAVRDKYETEDTEKGIKVYGEKVVQA